MINKWIDKETMRIDSKEDINKNKNEKNNYLKILIDKNLYIYQYHIQ